MHENVVASPQLSGQGKQKIEWVKRNMPILQQIEVDFREQQYFQGTRVLVCIHLEAKTAYLAQVLAAGEQKLRSPEATHIQPKTMWWPR